MIDPMSSLAISMHSKKGAYALLIGSGVSKTAQIPTGWDIVLSLIKSVACVEGKDCGAIPEAWYRETYREEPSYSVLLERLGIMPAERNQILRKYIEPSPEERDLGLKLPTEAHRAIAELVASGFVRVILTTNFDRLLETALGEMGVVPAIIDSADAAKGTLPLVHNACTILKLHGDYIDSRIRNTTDELAKYPAPINRLLDQILSEYGLIVCGWSGDYDTALAAALRRKTSPWFVTYWSTPRSPRDAAQKLIEQRQAQVVTNMDADAFFRRLADSVTSLEDISAPELVSSAVAQAAVKRYIDDPSKRIRLHDLVVGEASRIQKVLEELPSSLYVAEFEPGAVLERLQWYQARTEVLRTMFVTGCYWARDSGEDTWARSLERLAVLPEIRAQSYKDWGQLRLYPALITLYAGGIAAVASENYATLQGLLVRATAIDYYDSKRTPLILRVGIEMLTDAAAVNLANRAPADFVMLWHLWETVSAWPQLREYLPDNDRLEESYDRFEYLAALARVDIRHQQGQRDPWAPKTLSCFRNWGDSGRQLIKTISNEVDTFGQEWPPLQGGMFGGSLERFKRAREVYDRRILQSS